MAGDVERVKLRGQRCGQPAGPREYEVESYCTSTVARILASLRHGQKHKQQTEG